MESSSVTGKPRIWLRLDGAVLFAASIVVFSSIHVGWWLFPALLFIPDVSMLGYLRDTRLGAFVYNAGHSYFLPSLCVLDGWASHHALVGAVGVIWLGHIGLDRLLGYGLKYDSGFTHTHLGDL